MSRLRREVRLAGAVLLGLGSILGTGVFVSIGLAADVAGSAVIGSTLCAVAVATFIALNVAQLAASHPVSGGTYEYGYKYVNPTFGFTAGWTFLLAKGFSAAAAALGFAGYVVEFTNVSFPPRALAVVTIATLTALVIRGIRRSTAANALIVSVTLLALGIFIAFGIGGLAGNAPPTQQPAELRGWQGFFEAAAFMFVAFAGFGRLATIGEEVVDPVRNIPRAILLTLGIAAALYIGIGVVAVYTAGAAFGRAAVETAAPLFEVARIMDSDVVQLAVLIGAMTALLSVLLNLILGLSRVLLAMARRGDMPTRLATINVERSTPAFAVTAVGVAIAGLALLGDVRVAWSFSAFALLLYYGITSYAAVRLPADARRYHVSLGWIGVVSCGVLAVFVELQTMLIGAGLVLMGFGWRAAMRAASDEW